MEWIAQNWEAIVAGVGAVALASRAVLFALAGLMHLFGWQKGEDEMTAVGKCIDGIASGLKVTALNVPKTFQNTGDGNSAPPLVTDEVKVKDGKLLVTWPFLALAALTLLAASGCVAPQTIQDAYALEGQAITQYVANGERIDKAWADIYTEARRSDLDYTTEKVTQLLKDKALAGKLTPDEVAAAVKAVVANREKAQADTAKVVVSMQRLQTVNRNEIAKALRLHGTLADWLAAGVDASAIPGMIDEIGTLIQTFRVPATTAAP